MARNRKKSYNPFRMWGSYVGALVVTSIAILTQETGRLEGITRFIYKPLFFVFNVIFQGQVFFTGIGAVITTFLYGFLIGWGIHSLFRKLNKGGRK